MWQRGADELDRPDQVGRDDVLNLLVSKFFRRSKQAVASVADQHVDAPELREGAFDDLVDRRLVGDVEQFGAVGLGVSLKQIGDLPRVAHCSDDAIAPAAGAAR